MLTDDYCNLLSQKFNLIMTKEEARLTLQENFGYLSEEHPQIIEAMRVAMNALSQPSLPSNLDEAAEEYEKNHTYQRYDGGGFTPEYDATLAEAFIAGVEWQAKQMPIPEDTVLFQKGVEEGRRLERDDISLTWEDMAKIDAIILDANNEFAIDYSKEIDRQKFYEEVLRRFRR